MAGRAQVAPLAGQHEVPAGVHPEPHEDVLHRAGGGLVGLREPDLGDGPGGAGYRSVPLYFRFTLFEDGGRLLVAESVGEEACGGADAGGGGGRARGQPQEHDQQEADEQQQQQPPAPDTRHVR